MYDVILSVNLFAVYVQVKCRFLLYVIFDLLNILHCISKNTPQLSSVFFYQFGAQCFCKQAILYLVPNILYPNSCILLNNSCQYAIHELFLQYLVQHPRLSYVCLMLATVVNILHPQLNNACIKQAYNICSTGNRYFAFKATNAVVTVGGNDSSIFSAVLFYR